MSRRAGTVRGHRSLEHTADVGLRAWAPDLPGLFEEAALALAEIAADVPPLVGERPAEGAAATSAGPEAPGPVPASIALEAPDLAALAFAWLNELIGLADAGRSALVSPTVRTLAAEPAPAPARGQGSSGGAHGDDAPARWRLAATARFAPFGSLVRPRLGVKSATYHGLSVDADADGWTLTAYLDV